MCETGHFETLIEISIHRITCSSEHICCFFQNASYERKDIAGFFLEKVYQRRKAKACEHYHNSKIILQ